MRRTLVTLALGLLLATTQGCASMGVSSPFPNDPLTGGADAATSQLLDVPLPAGMQRYASHGYLAYGADGGREGLETLRGNVDAGQAAQTLFAAMQSQGWQLRLSLRKGNRAVYVYDKGNSMALLAFRRQTVMTIVEIWAGGRLPDGSGLSLPEAPTPELPGEQYPPLDSDGGHTDGADNAAPPVPGTTEQWGGSNDGNADSGGLQERSL